jgi:hypothetical protein
MKLKRVGPKDHVPYRCTVWSYVATRRNPFSDEKSILELLHSYSDDTPRKTAVIVVETFGNLTPLCRYYVE